METFADLLGESRAIEAVRQSVRRLVTRAKAGHRFPAILIGGETGTGKGLVARLIHRHGPRAQGPFVDVNCAAIPDTLLESELFGYERGAFTDARRAKPGLFQTAHRGTIFLDEIGLLPEALQAKLLKVLEEQTVRRLGSTSSEPVDVAIVSATNADLRGAVKARRFREDLYHRLAVLSLELPPLRERGQDVLLLARHFLSRSCAEYGLAPKQLSSGAEARLSSYPWPGNIRELGNVMERVALLAEGETVEGPMLELKDAPTALGAVEAGPAPAPDSDAIRDHLLAALERTGWNISHTATQLGLSRNTVRARIERYGLQPGPSRRARARKGGVAAARAERAPLGPARPAAPSAVRWEQRRVGFLRVDRIGADAEEPSLEANHVLDTLIQKAEAFGGRLLEITTSGITAAFGLEPVEDAPRRAALTAMSVHKAVLRDEGAAGIGRTMTSAIHVAQVPFAQAGDVADIDGNAKRQAWAVLDALVASAAAGTTVVSRPTTPLLARRFVVTPTAAREPSTGTVYRLVDYRHTPFDVGGNMGRFVGRDRELTLLRSRLESARQGQGQLLALVGEAGIGKSRLLFQFRQEIAAQGTVCLLGHCLSYGSSSPYHPLLEILRAAFRLAESDTPTIVADKIRHSLEEAGVYPAQAAPCLHQLLGIEHASDELMALSPEVIKNRTFEALHTLFLRTSQGQPLVLVVEDLHWIDQVSEEYLASLVERIAGKPVLLVVTYRPEYRGRHRWVGKGYYSQIRVDPLSADDAERLLEGLIGEREAVVALKPLLLERTEGNPFFIEESIRAMVETGALVGAPGSYQVVKPVAHIEVPVTVYEVLAARIDRLPREEKRILHCSSVVGKDVSVEILAGVAGSLATALEPILAHLRGAEFLYETGGVSGPEYTFTHTLTHEVAYSSIIDSERRAAHARAVEVIETLHTDRLAEHVEDLARHSLRGEVWEKAAEYLGRAAARALARSANREAAALLEQALTAVAHLPRDPQTLVRAVDLQFDLRNVLQSLGEFKAMRERLEAARADVEALDDLRRLGRLSAYLADNYRVMGEHDRAVEWGERALALADSLSDLELQVTANTYLGQICLAGGGYGEAIPRFTRNIEALTGDHTAKPFGSPQPRSVHSRTCLAWCLAELGQFPAARSVGEEGVEIARSLDHPLSLVTAYFGIGYVLVRKGDVAEALAILEPALEMTRAGHSPVWFPRIASLLGELYGLAGRPHQGRPLIEEALERASAMSLVSGRSLMLVWLTGSWMAAGELGRAWNVGEHALALAREHKEQGHEAWALYTIGRLAARVEPSDQEKAAGLVADALRLATDLGMRPLVAHCHVGLGKLSRRAGKPEQAHEHLTIATAMYREMDMRFWLEQAEGDRDT